MDGRRIMNENENLTILHEDNHIIVVLKPQNVPSCEDESKDKDMLSLIKEYIKETYDKKGNVYVGLVHRLDRPTGGVMVFAKSSKAAARFSEQMKNGDFEKKYMTVLVGKPREDKAVMKNYLKKNSVNNMVYTCGATEAGAKYAELDYTVLDYKDGLSFTEVRLHTGRSHQIRVQMSSNATPVYGDMRYGGEKARKGYLALWAYYLSFTHPVSKERMVFRVEPPKDVFPWNQFDTSKTVTIVKPE